MSPADQSAEEELRLAVVLNGGVSLAVWMGGVVLELQRLTNRHGVYGRLLNALSSRARADIIAGTSAGGINGGALAVGQVFPDSDVARLRDVWAEEGALYDLLQDPWTGKPASLLKGDEGFLPALRTAFAELLNPSRRPGPTAYSPEFRPIHLTLTTTLLTADARTVTDALGAAGLPAQPHRTLPVPAHPLVLGDHRPLRPARRRSCRPPGAGRPVHGIVPGGVRARAGEGHAAPGSAPSRAAARGSRARPARPRPWGTRRRTCRPTPTSRRPAGSSTAGC